MIGVSPTPLDKSDLVSEPALTTAADFSMQSDHLYQICIRSAVEKQAESGLVSILEGLLPVRFTVSDGRPAVAGEIIIEDSVERSPSIRNPSVPSFSLPDTRSSPDGKLIDISVQFAGDPRAPFPFRGRRVQTKVASEPEIISLSGNEKVLANSERGPVWVESDVGGVKHVKSGFALPVMPSGGNLHDVLSGERFLEMLPLLHWIREICAGSWYEGPPLRAGFMFDDPNLHWSSYGFVDYRQIAAQAAKENYHVSFATIPLDTWFTHEATAEIFRRHASQISLCVHGNDHTKMELTRDYAASARVALLRQAVRRIERLERRAGLKVSRVMVPPHGACTEEMLEAIPQCGFEAACISHGSLRAHNKTRQWTKNLGWLPSELIQGCPVLPRWSFAGNTTNTILLAAFLNQPMILRGHHQDLKGGIELLDQPARVINSLGSVSWSNMTDLSRASYRWRMDGATCRLQPLGRKVTFRIPDGTTRLIIETPGNSFEESWQIVGPNGATLTGRAGEEFSLAEEFSGTISIEVATAPERATEHTTRRPKASAFVRRLLTEGRDRILSF